jgi:RND family efflux transporter MFP subunit
MARADIGVKEAQHAVAQKSRLHAQTMLQYAQIVAPFDGIVTKRNVDKGQFVQPATGTRGDILFTIARTDIMRIFVEVPELEAGWVTSGMPASVRVQALRGEELAGRVTRTSWSLDRTTRTLLAAIDLPNPDGKLRPGMYAYATITGEQADVLTLPASAIVTQGDVTQGYRSFCYIVQDGKARRTLVELGARDEKWVEVLKKQAATPGSAGQPRWESFRGDEAVIAGDVSGLSDGRTVQPAVPAK